MPKSPESKCRHVVILGVREQLAQATGTVGRTVLMNKDSMVNLQLHFGELCLSLKGVTQQVKCYL